MTKTFFSRARAEMFADSIKAQGFEVVQIWMDTDAFGQKNYIVKWY